MNARIRDPIRRKPPQPSTKKTSQWACLGYPAVSRNIDWSNQDMCERSKCSTKLVVSLIMACCLTTIWSAPARADIAVNRVVYGVGPLLAGGEEYVNYRILVAVSELDDWTSAQLSATVTDATFYQSPTGDGNPPDPAGFPAYPDSERTSYYTSPADYPNMSYAGGIVAFNAGPVETTTSLDADWFDVVSTGDGTFVVVQITVLPGTSAWTGQIDVTVFSANNPGGVAGSWPISAADYQPPVTATYIGATGGTYNDPLNWDIGVVPINATIDRYNVIVPDNHGVTFDLPGTSEINGLSLGAGGAMNFVTGESLEVRGTAVVGGTINASGPAAAFLAPSQFSAFTGSRPKAFASGGATIHVAAPSYYYNWGITSNHTILSAAGADSLLNLSSLNSMSVPFNVDQWTTYVYTIAATDSGVIDMSSAISVTGALSWSNDWLRFLVASGGDINLDSLTLTEGRTWFDIDVPSYSLPSLQSASTTHIDATDSLAVDLPALGAFNSGTFTVPNGATVDAPLMGAFTWSSMNIADGGIVNAPQLGNVSGSYLELNPSRVLNVPPFSNIDHARILLSQGATLDTVAPSYLYNAGIIANQTILAADGVNTLLDLSSLTAVSAPFNIDQWTTFVYAIIASDSGIIDMSNVTSLTGASSSGNDWLVLAIASDGDIDLSSLAYLDGRAGFDIDIADYALPSLQEAAQTVGFDLNEGTMLHLPSLERILGWGNSIIVPVFATFEAPIVTQMAGTTIDLSVGGTLDVPSLTTFTSGTLMLTQIEQGGPYLTCPPFSNIDNSRLILDDGSVFTVAATSYHYNPGITANLTILSTDGVGTLLDMSSIGSVSVPFNRDMWTTYTYTITASTNSIMDMSGVSSIAGAALNSNDWLKITNNSGGRILLGDVLVSGGRTQFVIDGTGSGLDFVGGFALHTPSQFTATLAATVNLVGDYSFNHTNEADINTGGGIFEMIGSGTQLLEVGGEYIGMPSGPVSGNFEIGQLSVGQPAQANIVQLVDNIDNGNRGFSGVEALYLQGFPGSENGLRILGGSTLVIQNVQVYAQESDLWVHINGLFPPGVNQIPYDQGFIALSIVVDDCNNNGIDDSVDILLGLSADCNGNGVPDECEISVGSPAPGGPFYCTTVCDPDCNDNGIPDECDITSGLSQDCNENGVPDDCDIAAGTSQDTNGNGIPDECEDCNNNGIPDYQDLADCDGSPWCSDCNNNGILDVCDIAAGTSLDVDGNGIPDECEADCNENGIPDAWDISSGASQDCNGNAIPDECDIAAGTSTDVNGNGVPDECEPDCNENGIPDDWDISTGTSQDCNGNAIPDECDIAAGTSGDINGNGIPDECEPDCNENGVPDDWDISSGVSEDCNENGIPDECDIASGTSLDIDGNGVPDECQDCNENGVLDWMDIANGTSEDCNGNLLPDECEAGFDLYQWIGPDGALFTDPTNWDQGAVPGGDVAMSNSATTDNRAILNAASEKQICDLTIDATGDGDQILQIDDGSLLQTAGTTVATGGGIDLQGGSLLGPTIDNTGGNIHGYGVIDGDVVNQGTIQGQTGRVLTIAGPSLDNQVGGGITAPIASVISVESATVSQAGEIEVRTQASIAFAGPLTNSSGGSITLLGGSLAADGLTNDAGGNVGGTGTIDTSVVNDGDMTFFADTLLLGSLANEGLVTIQNGTLTISGGLSGSGQIIGDFFGDSGNDGLAVLGDYTIGAAGSLTISEGTLQRGGNLDVAIDDFNRFDLTGATLQMVGLPAAAPQMLEVSANDIGRHVTLPDASLFSLGSLRIGPTATTVMLVNNHANSGGLGGEALYVEDLTLEPGVTLDLAGLRLYYGVVIPEDPFGPGSGVTVIDSIGGGSLCQIGPVTGDGDFDGDCDVDTDDLPIFIAVLLGLDTDPDHLLTADINGDGAANGDDTQGFMNSFLQP